jgi:YbbR domain-containing protein
MGTSMRNWMNNLGTIILALLLAFVIWIAAKLQDDPFTTQQFSNVPLEVVNKPKDTVLYEEVVDRVAVTVRAPASVVQELKLASFEATLNLAGIPPGVRTTVPITVTSDNTDVRIQVVEPAQQVVLLEPLQTLTLPVSLAVSGEAATGYQAMAPLITPNQISVRGPAPLLTQVVSVTGSISVDGIRDNLVKQVAVAPVDADGQPLSNLQWTPQHVEVRIGVQRKVGYKPDVEVVPDLRGDPAPGYRLGSVTVTPSTVTLAGLPSVLNDLPGFIETLPISITGATQNLSMRSLLTVPASVVVVDANYVTVLVDILPIQSSRTLTQTVEIEGVPPGWLATASPPVVDVILEGPDAVLAGLTPDDIQIRVSVFGLGAGTQRLTPEVLAPEGVTVVSVIPETVEVALQPGPTRPPPTATPVVPPQ